MKIKKKYIVSAVLVVAALAGWFLTPSLESIVQKLVHKYGSQITGTEVKLGGFRLSLFDGEAELKNLSIANPKNYTQPYIMRVGDVSVKVDLASLLTDTIVVEKVQIKKPEVSYELLSVTQNNVSALLENIKKNTGGNAKKSKPAAAKPEAAEAKSGGKKVLIKSLIVADGNVNLAASVAGHGAAATISLPDIKMQDIGKEKSGNGSNPIEVVTAVLNKIFNSTYEAVVKSKLVDLKSVAEDSMNKVIESVKEKSGVKGWFGLKK